MAERRMFAKSIVLSDAFLDMPLSARCLYFTLGMLADDDGFIGSPKAVMRQCGASQDDMIILLQKRFILSFESGVIVIKHWRLNNYLKSDRHKDTTYVEEKAELTLDEKGAYTEAINEDTGAYSQNVSKMSPKCLRNGDTGKVRLGKDSIGKNINNNIYNNNINNTLVSSGDDTNENPSENPSKNPSKNPSDDTEKILRNDFEIIYSLYPKKGTKQSAFESYKKWVQKSGRKVGGKTYHLTNKQIWDAVKNYVTIQENNGTQLEYYKNFVTLMNQLLDWVIDDE